MLLKVERFLVVLNFQNKNITGLEKIRFDYITFYVLSAAQDLRCILVDFISGLF